MPASRTRREDALLAEHVAELCDALLGDRGNLLVDDLGDVLVGVDGLCPFARRVSLDGVPTLGYGVGTHEGRNHVDGMSVVGLIDDREHPEFRLGVETVAGLHLDGGRPVREHGVEVAEQVREELLVTRLTGRPDGPEDAAALRQNLLVGLALQLGLELVGAVAREQGVGVRVHEPRNHGPTAGVHRIGCVLGRKLAGHRSGRADASDLAVHHRDGGVCVDAEVVGSRLFARQFLAFPVSAPFERDDLFGVVDHCRQRHRRPSDGREPSTSDFCGRALNR
jgi:hypothetical protein